MTQQSEAMKYNHKVNNFESPMMKLQENIQSIRHSSMLFKTYVCPQQPEK